MNISFEPTDSLAILPTHLENIWQNILFTIVRERGRRNFPFLFASIFFADAYYVIAENQDRYVYPKWKLFFWNT